MRTACHRSQGAWGAPRACSTEPEGGWQAGEGAGASWREGWPGPERGSSRGWRVDGPGGQWATRGRAGQILPSLLPSRWRLPEGSTSTTSVSPGVLAALGTCVHQGAP